MLSILHQQCKDLAVLWNILSVGGFCNSVGALTIALPSCGHLTEDTAKGTDDWIPAEIETATEKGIPTEDLRLTTNATSRQTCTTTDVAARGSESEMSPTGGKAAGVSTNEGGVEQGPIADPPRWVQSDLKWFNSPHPSLLSLPLSSVCLSVTNHFFPQLLSLVSSTIFMIWFFSVSLLITDFFIGGFILFFLVEHFHFY